MPCVPLLANLLLHEDKEVLTHSLWSVAFLGMLTKYCICVMGMCSGLVNTGFAPYDVTSLSWPPVF